jgi:hypothetical protein
MIDPLALVGTDTGYSPYDMAGDDMMPNPLFKNIPRRPRSAASAFSVQPRKEEPDGKRPSSTVNDAEIIPGTKKKHCLFPISEPEDACYQSSSW